MDVVHLYGVYLIRSLQDFFPSKWQEEFFFISSHIGDPKNAFILYFPLIFAWKKREGRQLLLAAVGSEWLNLILKWCLRGERPYWWVHESNVSSVSLKQFYITCETGPGSPSGHVMVTCAVGLFLVLALTNVPYFTGRSLTITVWCVYFGIVFLVSVSRIFIAAHFPHQIIFAFFLGNVIGNWIWKDSTTDRLPRFYFLSSAGLVLFTILFYKFISLFFDPAYSIPKAIKWCSNKEFIRLDTTPFYALVRDAGALLGIGISQLVVKDCRLMENDFSVMKSSFQAMLSIFFARCLETLPFPVQISFFFYLLGFLKNVTLVVVVMTFVPFLVNYLCGVNSSERSSVKPVASRELKKCTK